VTTAPATFPLILVDMSWDSGWGIVWGLAIGAFWIAVIAVIVVMLRAVTRRPEGVGGGSALELLEERYARGEVTRDEFLERRAVLTDKGTQGQT
jgi:putative membrane protein